MPGAIEVRVEKAEVCSRIGIPCLAHSPGRCPYPGLAAGIVEAMAAVTAGTVAGEDTQVVEVQRAVAVRLDLDYPGRIASHNMVVVAVVLVLDRRQTLDLAH